MASFCMFDVGESVVPSAVRRAHLATVGPEWTDSAAFFFCFVLRGCVSDSHLLAAVSSFILLPVSAASHDRRSRLEAEASLTAALGTLNPPRGVYSIARVTGGKGLAGFGQRIFGTLRPLCRIRSRSRGSSQNPLTANGHARKDDWKAGLRLTAAAL